MELKPCPKCKDIWDIKIIVSDDSVCIDGILDVRNVYRLKCSFCGTSTDWRETPEQAVKEWNRRADNGIH